MGAGRHVMLLWFGVVALVGAGCSAQPPLAARPSDAKLQASPDSTPDGANVGARPELEGVRPELEGARRRGLRAEEGPRPARQRAAPTGERRDGDETTTAAASRDPFPGQQRVSVTELVDALEVVAKQLESAPAVERDYAAFLAAHDLPDSPTLFRDYVRVKLAFEATRDGGWWHMRWAVTNRKPNSERIWTQWAAADVPTGDDPGSPTAVAECDELSALFAFMVRKLGVRRVGLFWPVWNHVVAVWTVDAGKGTRRIVIPTSQILLDENASLGTDGFDPKKQRTIYTYGRRDVAGEHRIPAALARFFVQQAAALGAMGQAEQQARRNARSALLGGS